ncbi:MAG: cytochrome c biogenesis protein CcsA [Planctomycetota bacterium]
MRKVLILLTFILLLASVWIGLTKGRIIPLQRNIIYFHVPGSICALACFVMLLVASIGCLCTKKKFWDYLGAASAEAALLFATVLNLTGSVFSRAEWNLWWTPSPKLVTSAILWFLALVYIILRTAIPDKHRRARICAVFGIIAFLDVPMVYVSARLIPDIHRQNFTFDSAWQSAALAAAIAAALLLAGLLIWLRTDLLQAAAELDDDITC